MGSTSRRKFLQTGASVAAVSVSTSALSASTTKSERPKNVLFIGVDDLNTSLGCYGNKTVHTPNLDRLAARGVRFDADYCQYPLCSPSRSSLMTGLAPDTTKVYGNNTHFRQHIPNAVTIGELFRKNSYFSARVGKILHYDNPEQIGTDGLDDPVTWDYVHDPCGVDHLKDEPLVTNFTPNRGRYDPFLKGDRLGSTISFYPSPAPDDEITDGIGAKEVIRLLGEKRREPFFIAFGLYRPHVPWIVPSRYFTQYPIDSIQANPFDPSELKIAPPPAYWTHPPNFGMNEMQRRRAIQGYYAATTFMDAQVGKVLTALETLGLAENTLVVFWADHGWQLGQHGQWMKQTLFEHATRVPLIFAGAGVPAQGVTIRHTVEHLDIYPTVAELCGLKGTPEKLHGQSLVRLLKNPNEIWSKPAVTQQARGGEHNPSIMGYSIRTERYRCTSWQDGYAGEELYDYQNDPRELNNLADDPKMYRTKFTLLTNLNDIIAARGRSHIHILK